MPRGPDVHFTPVPDRVLAEMLRIAAVGANDVIYDLGCGDGRILIAAAREFRARGVGVDIDAERVAESIANARQAGVGANLEFRQEDFFNTDLRPASVVALYLLDSLNVRLRPKILAECRPGTRVVTYSFDMGEWECDAHTPIAANGVSLWVVPGNLTGRWVTQAPGGTEPLRAITVEQTFQKIAGVAEFGGERGEIRDGRIAGERFEFVVQSGEDSRIISGRITDDCLQALIRTAAGESLWNARREPHTRRALVDGVSR